MAGIKNRDDRQIKFLSYYLDPKSETYSNALQSALRAGYTQKYAENITALNLEWVGEAMGRRVRMLNKAEVGLEELLNSKNEGVKLSVSQFLAKTLGKKFYSEKQAFEGEDGKSTLEPLADAINKLANKK